jgi:hypothetical protein
MSGDGYDLAEIGGTDLVRHYPDQGLLASSPWHNAVLHFEPETSGILGWFQAVATASHGFMAVLSADREGLRVLVNLEQFVVFIPRTEATVSAERGVAATVVRLTTTAIPWLTLVFGLDDVAADEIFHPVVPLLPTRNPPRRLAWWLAEWWVVSVFVAIAVSAGLILWLLVRTEW